MLPTLLYTQYFLMQQAAQEVTLSLSLSVRPFVPFFSLVSLKSVAPLECY